MEIKLSKGEKVYDENPKNKYVLEYEKMHGDADHHETEECHFKPKQVDYLMFDLLIFMLSDSWDGGDFRDLQDEYDKICNDHHDIGDYVWDLLGHDVVYTDNMCRCSAQNLYYYDSDGLKYEAKINGTPFSKLRYGDLNEMIYGWFIGKFPGSVNKINIPDKIIKKYKDYIEGSKMGLL